MSNSKMFKSAKVNVRDLSAHRYSVPTYQRPYVWEKEHIEKLLTDSAAAFATDASKPYYVGTVITSAENDLYELIDGQQRFTTLWLTAFVFNKKGIKSEITGFLRQQNTLRLDFAIRQEVADYLDLLLRHPDETITKYTGAELEERPYLVNIVRATTTIGNLLDTMENPQTKQPLDLAAFGNYLYRNLMLVHNTAPQGTSLNSLFATINNSGVQLEQTDIVKAALLSKLQSERVRYGKIWECCENMDDFFERNVRSTFHNTNWRNLQPEDFAVFNANIFLSEAAKERSEEKGDGYTIREILDSAIPEVLNQESAGAEEQTFKVNCESILNFGQLLLHAFRIFLFRTTQKDFEGTFHVNRLVKLFEALVSKDETEIKAFIDLLWEVRYAFDAHIVKWITDQDSKERRLELTSVSRSDQREAYSYFGRMVVEKKRPDLMLQSVLYFTGDYFRQFWLTPYLHFLVKKKTSNLAKLEQIDNLLSLTSMPDKEASWELMKDQPSVTANIDIQAELEKPNGTSFRHYWFQKLEYVLWKSWPFDKAGKFDQFRITSKNSVEHIFPQNPKYREPLEEGALHCFGNLVLLSVVQNSEYSRKEVDVKRAEFNTKPSFDSLKSYYVFSTYTDNFGEVEIKKHRDEMITVLRTHYKI